MSDLHPICLTQVGARLTISSPDGVHPYDVAVLGVNETAIDPDHFSTRSCREFRARVLSIWGPGGTRTTTPRREDGKPVDREGYAPHDGKLGPRESTNWPEDG